MYKLHCFGQSGNAYKAALMLALSGADWTPVFVDFFKGATRDPAFREGLNEMGEVPVLEHGGKTLCQSGVILTYLADHLGKFGGGTEEEKLDILRWVLFDNHKFTSYFATYRFMYSLMGKPADPAVLAFLKGRVDSAFAIVEKHLSNHRFIACDRATIADISMLGYMYYPVEEHGYDLAATHPHIDAWRKRFQTMLGWKGPYELMPAKAA